MDLRERCSKLRQLGGIELAIGQTSIELPHAVELTHAHRVVDDLPAATDLETGGAAADRHDTDVQRRRKAAIQADLFRAEHPSARQRREIDETKVDWTLDLVDVIPGQQHPRDVRFDQFDRGATVRVGTRVQQIGKVFRQHRMHCIRLEPTDYEKNRCMSCCGIRRMAAAAPGT
jgi:hypothetical protein